MHWLQHAPIFVFFLAGATPSSVFNRWNLIASRTWTHTHTKKVTTNTSQFRSWCSSLHNRTSIKLLRELLLLTTACGVPPVSEKNELRDSPRCLFHPWLSSACASCASCASCAFYPSSFSSSWLLRPSRSPGAKWWQWQWVQVLFDRQKFYHLARVGLG